MRIVIIGGGIIGLTSAYTLSQRGHEVCLVEQNSKVGHGASFANGNQLSFSYVDPFVGQGFLGQLPKILGGKDKGISATWQWTIDWWRWNLATLWQASEKAFYSSLSALSDLAKLSAQRCDVMFSDIALQAPINRCGKLITFTDRNAFNNYIAVADYKRAELGVDIQQLNTRQVIDLEPAIAHWEADLAGGIYAPDDLTLDTFKVCQEVLAYLLNQPTFTYRLGETVIGFKQTRQKIYGIQTETDEYPADAVVIAAGVSSHQLAKKLGLDLGINPIYGYSFTAPATTSSPKISVTSLADRVVFAPNKGQLRVAGFAHNGSSDITHKEHMLKQLKATAKQRLPQAAQYSKANSDWQGARPMRASSLPLISATPISNLYLNTGHGSLGWTLACGSAHLLSELINGQSTAINAQPYRYR